MSEDEANEAWMWAVALGLEARTFPLGSPWLGPWLRRAWPAGGQAHGLEVRKGITTLIFTGRDGFDRWLDEEAQL